MADKLSKSQIAKLPEELRPGFEGQDSQGIFKIDDWGVKRRPFEKGGPSPNSAGRGASKKIMSPEEIIKDNDYLDPLQLLMAYMNGDIDTLNKTRNKGYKIDPSSIKLSDQIEVAKKLMPFFVNPAKNTSNPVIDAPSGNKSGKGKLALSSPGRRALLGDE